MKTALSIVHWPSGPNPSFVLGEKIQKNSNTIGRTLKIDCHLKCSAVAQLLGILNWDAHIHLGSIPS